MMQNYGARTEKYCDRQRLPYGSHLPAKYVLHPHFGTESNHFSVPEGSVIELKGFGLDSVDQIQVFCEEYDECSGCYKTPLLDNCGEPMVLSYSRNPLYVAHHGRLLLERIAGAGATPLVKRRLVTKREYENIRCC